MFDNVEPCNSSTVLVASARLFGTRAVGISVTFSRITDTSAGNNQCQSLASVNPLNFASVDASSFDTGNRDFVHAYEHMLRIGIRVGIIRKRLYFDANISSLSLPVPMVPYAAGRSGSRGCSVLAYLEMYGAPVECAKPLLNDFHLRALDVRRSNDPNPVGSIRHGLAV